MKKIRDNIDWGTFIIVVVVFFGITSLFTTVYNDSICDFCGAHHQIGAWCEKCGRSVNSKYVCPKCHVVVSRNAEYCNKCGEYIKDSIEDQKKEGYSSRLNEEVQGEDQDTSKK